MADFTEDLTGVASDPNHDPRIALKFRQDVVIPAGLVTLLDDNGQPQRYVIEDNVIRVRPEHVAAANRLWRNTGAITSGSLEDFANAGGEDPSPGEAQSNPGQN